MAHEFENEDGEIGTYYSPEEVEQQKAAAVAEAQAEAQRKMAEAEAHYKVKLDEFTKGKRAVDEKESVVEAALAEAKAIAEEAKAEVLNEKNARIAAVKQFMFEQVVGSDKEQQDKLQKSYDLLNMPATTDAEIQERVKMAATLAQVSLQQAVAPTLGAFSGGYAPVMKADTNPNAEADYQKFKEQVGL